MTTRAIAVSFALIGFMFGCSESGPEAYEVAHVFGKDDRVTVPLSFPWTTIGRVQAKGKLKCTGTLVAPHLVLTASHCVFNDAKNDAYRPIHFFPAFAGKDDSPFTVVDSVYTLPPSASRPLRSDWALLLLKDPIGHEYGWLEIVPTTIYDFPHEIHVAGYSRDFKEGRELGVHFNCHFRNGYVAVEAIGHDCDMNDGASGGPVLAGSGRDMKIYGVNVGHSGDDSEAKLAEYSSKYANIAILATEAKQKLDKFQQGKF